MQSASALTFDELQGLTYLQVKGSGIANTCPVIEGGSSNLKDLKPATYKISKFCMEPTAFKVKEESQFANKQAEFVKTKLMTRLTYTLDEVRLAQILACVVAAAPLLKCIDKLGLLQMSGTFKVDSGGKVEFQEEDGIDYAPVTVQLPGGERVPFLFTVKELNAKGSLDGFGGDFTVPSYRGSSFLDPKVCTPVHIHSWSAVVQVLRTAHSSNFLPSSIVAVSGANQPACGGSCAL